MEIKENLKSEETKLAEEELTDLTVDNEQAAEMKGGAIPRLFLAVADGDH